MSAARFHQTQCSQCAGTFGPGNEGFSHCEDHQGARCGMQRDSYTDKTLPKWPPAVHDHGSDDMVFNREFWIAILAYLLVLLGVVVGVYAVVAP